MSTPTNRRKPLIGNSPFEKLAQRTVETGNEALKEARQIDINLIDTNPRQPRRTFDEKALEELAADIKERGILQPPIVRVVEDRFEIVVGERRYRAAKQAGLKNIPVLVRQLNDQQAEITSLIENIQRENLSLSDEAAYFNMLKSKYGYSIREIAEEVAHKSAGYVDVRLKLAEHPEVLNLVENQQIGIQKANQLVRLDDKTLQTELKKLQTSLQPSQSVFSKDTSLQQSQIKDGQSDKHQADRTATLLAKPFVVISREIEKVASRYEQSTTEERAILLDSLDQLEQEISKLKRKLKSH